MRQPALAYRLLICSLVLALVSSCAPPAGAWSSAGSGYWIPPSAPATPTAPAGPKPALLIEPSATPTELSLPSTPIPTLPEPSTTPTAEPPPPTATAIPAAQPLQPSPTPEIYVVDTAPILYYAQAADTLKVVSVRFGVQPQEISSSEPIADSGFINPGQLLIIPKRLTNTTSSQHLLPDSEVVYSPSAVSFNAVDYAAAAGGYLASYREWHKSTGMKTGAEIVERVAIENSINPRLLLALLEYHSGWVMGTPAGADQIDYPMGLVAPNSKGLYNQLIWAVNQLSVGYYAYREGRLTELRFQDGSTARLAPDLNAGTAALQYYFAQTVSGQDWLNALDIESGLPAQHARLFGSPWERAQMVEPLYPAGIVQPPLNLPFGRDWTWSFTGGPHGAWEQEGAYAALDFAPGATQPGCVDTTTQATAAAAGLVVRTGPGLVVLDLDGDGHEQTGWVLVYLHIAEKGRARLGDWVAAGDPIGNPSCEGGFATGTHLHIARKYNGEWVPADGPLPFNLGGWVAKAGPLPYKGTLTRGDVTLTACTCSNYLTFITRTADDP
jgi:murein DD-endopeptidase MepM/ murein hydrolase activator NlpD